MTQQILVVDDDRQIARLVRAYLEQAGYQALVAYDGETAWRSLSHDRPDLVILDLMLPDRDGWSITRDMRGDRSLAHIPIIMLTARVEDTDKIVGLELGADDYIAKPFNPREVVARVRAVLRRAAVPATAPHVMAAGDVRLDLERHVVTVRGEAVDVTPTEFDLLRMLMEHPGHVLTRQDLIEKGLGYDYAGAERTVDSHIKNLRKKIETDPARPTYIQTVHGVGYRFQAEV
ncbi:MAG: response regulator transcription factor [Anaerolineae bacterium]|nr:response regulator transcription factor [Anaerolineae bacterium]